MENTPQQNRIDVLKRQIENMYLLLSKYENNHILEDDPRRKMRQEQEIMQLKAEIEQKELELRQLTYKLKHPKTNPTNTAIELRKKYLLLSGKTDINFDAVAELQKVEKEIQRLSS